MRLDVIVFLMGVGELILRLSLGAAGFWCIWNGQWDDRVGVQLLGLICIWQSINARLGLRSITVTTESANVPQKPSSVDRVI